MGLIEFCLRCALGLMTKEIVMSKEEKLDKIIEMTREIIRIKFDKISDDEIDEIYIQTKIMLETLKELKCTN